VEEGVPEEKRRKTRVALLRYHGQGGEIAVPWTKTREEVEAAFTQEHRSLYGFALEAPIELVTLRVEATGLTAANPQARLADCAAVEPYGHTPVHFEGGNRDVPLVDRAALGAGASFVGPVILTQLDTTTLVPPGWSGSVHETGAIILTRREGAAQ
jgi:N-methylhydantoinase A